MYVCKITVIMTKLMISEF